MEVLTSTIPCRAGRPAAEGIFAYFRLPAASTCSISWPGSRTRRRREIPAVRDLLKSFTSLADAVGTIDATHTQADTAQVILGRGADYVMTVKGTMTTLSKQPRKLPWATIPATSAVTTDHGRRARRTIKAVPAPA